MDETMKFGKWKQVFGYATPGGTPVYVCEYCGGSEHLHGAEYPRRKLVCDNCHSINIYPWEKSYEEEAREIALEEECREVGFR